MYVYMKLEMKRHHGNVLWLPKEKRNIRDSFIIHVKIKKSFSFTDCNLLPPSFIFYYYYYSFSLHFIILVPFSCVSFFFWLKRSFCPVHMHSTNTIFKVHAVTYYIKIHVHLIVRH